MPGAKYIYTELGENSNKFWHGRVEGSTVILEWGRVGEAGATKSKTFVSDEEALKFFESKCREKERKGYTAQQTFGASPASKVGNGNLRKIASEQIESDSDETRKLIDYLVKRNIHDIEGSTNLRFDQDSGQFTTPLGVVTLEGIADAEALLSQIATFVADGRWYDSEFERLVNRYLRIVPQDIGRKRIAAHTVFPHAQAVQAQKQLLDSLRLVVKDAEQKAVDDAPQVFRTKLSSIAAEDDDFKRIARKFRETSNVNHTSRRLRLKRVYKVEIEGAALAFETHGKKVGNVMELWHGTKDANLLSLLKSGYVIPRGGGSVMLTGRMFGDGVYFSDQSTKSLNYSYGYWSGTRSNRCFMLLNDVAMGKSYTPRSSMSGTCPAGYDSTFAKARQSGIINNEMVVYKTSQILPKYLCEFGE